MEIAGLNMAASGCDLERSGLRVRLAAKFDGDFGLETGVGKLGFAFAGADEDDTVSLFNPTPIEARRVIGLGADLNKSGADAS